MTTRSAYFISDGTGITVEALGHSLLAQFPQLSFRQITKPFINNEGKARLLVEQINQESLSEAQPIIISSLVDPDIRKIFENGLVPVIDIFATMLAPLEQTLQHKAHPVMGQAHGIERDSDYAGRMDAITFALQNDDGATWKHYDNADLILLGVSRSGKTPACIYLALHYGIRAANYPITEEDMDSIELPAPLQPHQDKLFGLTVNPVRLSAIRKERKANSRYASLAQCEFEVKQVETLLEKYEITTLNSTHLSVEEMATRIMKKAGIERRIDG